VAAKKKAGISKRGKKLAPKKLASVKPLDVIHNLRRYE
jgi:hypothetical protein